MSDPELIAALNRNTEAMTRLAVVWEKLHKRAEFIAGKPAEEVRLNAAGVPLVPPPADESNKHQPGGFVL